MKALKILAWSVVIIPMVSFTLYQVYLIGACLWRTSRSESKDFGTEGDPNWYDSQ